MKNKISLTNPNDFSASQ